MARRPALRGTYDRPQPRHQTRSLPAERDMSSGAVYRALMSDLGHVRDMIPWAIMSVVTVAASSNSSRVYSG